MLGLHLDLVAERRKENENTGKKQSDFLQVLVDAKYHPDGPALTDDEICSFGITFFSDGFETTSTTLTVLAFYLAKDQKAQKKLYEEVSKLSEVNSDTVSDLKYLEACVKETLRIWPPVLRNDRYAEEDYKLEGTNITIPKGMTVNFPIYAMQRDPKNFEDPDEFIPERWLAGGSNENSGPLAIQTFGVGPRICVGQRLAILNTKLTITRVLQQMKIEATPDSKLENVEGMNLLVVPKDCFLKFLQR